MTPRDQIPESSSADQPLSPGADTERSAVGTLWADEEHTATALTWVDPSVVEASTVPADLNARRPELRNRPLLSTRPLPRGIAAPIATMAFLVVAYLAATLLWPLNALPPTVSAVSVDTPAAAAANMSWPEDGSAAVGITGATTASSTQTQTDIASISKVVSVLMVLEKLPLEPGEQGPEYAFTWEDSNDYWRYRIENQSALDVPVDGVLTEYQMLQGILLGSANNYIDRLAVEVWGSLDEFALAAEQWLAAHGLTDMTIISPSGFDDRNVSTPAALITLSEIAMQQPIFAEIVAQKTVELPGAGEVNNSNPLINDPGVVGIKTGTLDTWNLLTAKDLTVGENTVRVYVATLGQFGDEERIGVTNDLLNQVQGQLDQTPVSVATGTVVGTVETAWGDAVDIVATADVTLPIWNGSAVTATGTFDLGDQRAAGDEVGTLAVSAMGQTVEIPVALDAEITNPSIWWRLTHPLQLFGLLEAD